MDNHTKTLLPLVGACCMLIGGQAAAEDRTYYGSEMMPSTERYQHRKTLRSMSPEAREAYRAQHHEQMQKRAEAMGRPFPDEPPETRAGAGRWIHSPAQLRKGPPGFAGMPGMWPPPSWAPGWGGGYPYSGYGGYGYPGWMGPGYMGPSYMGPSYMGGTPGYGRPWW